MSDDLDLRPKNAASVKWEKSDPLHDHSELWAGISKPFAWFVFSLIALVIILPFLIIAADIYAVKTDRLEMTMRWATTVLAPVIGFGSAVVGYYFGTSGAAKAKGQPEGDDE